MSTSVTISKLEALLSRIRTRAAEPRSTREAAPPAARMPAPVAAAMPARAVVPAPVVAPPAAAPPTDAGDSIPPEMLDAKTLPPPPLAASPGDVDYDVDVDVAATTPQPARAREPEARELSDSRERLAAAPAAPPDAVAVDAPDVGPSIERVEALSDDEATAGAAGEEDRIEEAPASSRRPVAPPPEERIAEIAFGAEEPQPARHTPPPKSGRLPAPPAVEFDADVTGVRAAPGLDADDEAISARGGEPSVLSPQTVRADLASGPSVRVDVIGEAQAFAPATFLALLDASLSL